MIIGISDRNLLKDQKSINNPDNNPKRPSFHRRVVYNDIS